MPSWVRGQSVACAAASACLQSCEDGWVPLKRRLEVASVEVETKRVGAVMAEEDAVRVEQRQLRPNDEDARINRIGRGGRRACERWWLERTVGEVALKRARSGARGRSANSRAPAGGWFV
eukprot:6195742-Pleurochrysis_carterae.AAC.1